MDVKALVRSACAAARAQQIDAESPGELHRKRSTAWVECLADQFRAYYRADQTVRVFSKGCCANRREFGLNELLYDVSVCRSGSVRSSVQGRQLLYIREVLWQVESEFARDGREALKDFSKLVCGSAQSKLFVGPQVADNESFINVLLPAARACTGQVIVVLLPHPRQWDSATFDVQAWELRADRWTLLL